MRDEKERMRQNPNSQIVPSLNDEWKFPGGTGIPDVPG